MDLEVSFSEGRLAPSMLRRLDLYFSPFEAIASEIAGAGEVLEIELTDASEVSADLDPEFPVLIWRPVARGDRRVTRTNLRVWRPPPAFLPPADRQWLERFGVLPNGRSPPVASRYGEDRRWRDPDERDIERCCAVLVEVTRRLTCRFGRVA